MKRVDWALLTWPQAFVMVFGGVPSVIFGLGALGVHPAVFGPTYAVAALWYALHTAAVRRDRRRAQALRLARHANVQHESLRAAEPDRFPTLPHGRLTWHAK